MAREVARIGDSFLEDPADVPDFVATGSADVFTNNIGTARLTDVTTGHTRPNHGFYPPVPIITGSGTVFVNNLPITRKDDAHATHCDGHPDCHAGVIDSYSPDVFADD